MNKIIVAVTLLVILAAVNWAIWDKEGHLAEGEVMYLELAPVDPRSLMQGDYMALNFALSNRIQSTLHQARADGDILKAHNGTVVVRLDEKRIAHFERLENGDPLSENERRLCYRLRNGQVLFATNAFFFQEGEAERYESARYGQFRINTDGKPLLVSLHNEALKNLSP
ncbi:MAG: GDYXXLXY domain-containing protein [Halomonas sp.]|uniref:GDYXXLXY domain-containing protein n=1 Tax=unclassified Halomonas TaxID=2609666 RepID=UPI00264A8D97|nr:GDYXXLXY domain-containing protein [Halomonas sp.]